jgi:hypothetical protein
MELLFVALISIGIGFILHYDGGLIWVFSLVAGGLFALVVGLALPPRRRTTDRAMLTKLSGGLA